jgi:hypothetical protein
MSNESTTTPPERRLQAAAKTGTPCNFEDDGQRLSPDKAEDWGPARTLTAAALRSVLVLDDEHSPARAAFEIIGARFVGRLNLSGCTITHPLIFKRCVFEVNVDESNEDELLSFSDANLKTVYIEDSTLTVINATGSKRPGYFKSINLTRSIIDGSIAIINSTMNGTLRAVGAVAKGDLNLHGTKIVAGEWLDADRLRVDGAVFLRDGFTCDGGVRLAAARIGADLDCRNSVLTSLQSDRAPFDMEGAHIGGFCSFRHTKVYAAGINAIAAESVSIGSILNLTSNFRSRGTLLFRSAKIGGTVNCSQSRFRGQQGNTDRRAFNFDSAEIGGSVFFRERFLCIGAIRLTAVSIGGNLEFTESSKILNRDQTAIDAERLRVAGYFLLRAIIIVGGINLMQSQIVSSFLLRNCQFRSSKTDENNYGEQIRFDRMTVSGTFGFDNVRFLPARDGEAPTYVSFTDASVRTFTDSPASWPARGCLLLNGFEYENLFRGSWRDFRIGGKSALWRERLTWLELQPCIHLSTEFRPQPFNQLARSFRRLGYDEDARRILIKARQYARRGKRWPGWAASVLMGGICGHGYRPYLTIIWMGACILVGGILFKNAEEYFVPTRSLPSIATATGATIRFDPWMYSLDSFLPFVNLQQKENFAPRLKSIVYPPKTSRTWARLAKIYRPFETLSGWVLAALFIAGVSGLIRRE